MLGDAGLNGSHARVLLPGSGISGDPYTDVPSVLTSDQTHVQVVSIDGTQYASAVIPFKVAS